MINAVSGAASAIQSGSAGIRPLEQNVTVDNSGAKSEKIQQAQEVVESYWNAEEAKTSVEVAMLRKTLDMSLALGTDLTQLSTAADAYNSNAGLMDQSQRLVDSIM